MSVIIPNGKGDSVEVSRAEGADGIFLVSQSEVPGTRHYDTCEIFIPKEWVPSLIAALEDEAGV